MSRGVRDQKVSAYLRIPKSVHKYNSIEVLKVVASPANAHSYEGDNIFFKAHLPHAFHPVFHSPMNSVQCPAMKTILVRSPEAMINKLYSAGPVFRGLESSICGR